MEKGKIVRLVLIPIILGLVITLIVRQMISSATPAPATSEAELVPVVTVASKEPIAARTKLTDAQLAIRQTPKHLLIGSEFEAISEVSGQITVVDLQPGEAVLRSRVTPEGRGALPYRIPAGTRALTIRIDELSGVAGYPEPGDLVDLVLVLPAKTPDRPAATSRMLYEAVPVLGKGPAGGAPKGQAEVGAKLTSLTVALKPESAAEVALAEQIGYVKVMLRPALQEPNSGPLVISETRYLGGAQTAGTKP